MFGISRYLHDKHGTQNNAQQRQALRGDQAGGREAMEASTRAEIQAECRRKNHAKASELKRIPDGQELKLEFQVRF